MNGPNLSFLKRPGFREGLMSAGMAMMAQSDTPGSTVLGNLGRALPVGVQAGREAATREQYDALMEGAPPQMRQLLKILGPERGAAFMLQQAGPAEPVALSEGAQLVDPVTGQVVAENARPTETEGPVTLSEGAELVDPVTGAVIASNAKNTSTEDAERSFRQTDALADDFYRETLVDKETADIVAAANAATESAVGDQTRVIALNKLLQPNSSVLEGEFNRVGQAGGLEARAQWYFNQMKDGRLPDTLRRELEAEIEAQVGSRRRTFGQTLERFRFRARANGVDPNQVTQDYYEQFGEPAADPLGIR